MQVRRQPLPHALFCGAGLGARGEARPHASRMMRADTVKLFEHLMLVDTAKLLERLTRVDTAKLFERLLPHVAPGIVCDVGSMNGADAARCARAVPGARVFAFEPNPYNL